MPCTEPKTAYELDIKENGKKRITFKKTPEHKVHKEIKLPCGQCISCKLGKAQEWATRAMHEKQTSGMSAFITLTYSPENLPDPPTVKKQAVQSFMKMLRKHLTKRYGQHIDRKSIKYLKTRCNFKYKPNIPIKVIACGEYGKEKGHRPHYHLLIFGYDFPDKRFWKNSNSNEAIYRSAELETIWKKGFSTVQEVTHKSAAYTCRYTLKKQTDKQRLKEERKTIYHHTNVDLQTGEIIDVDEYAKQMKKIGLEPEFLLMSKGIGKDWYNKYKRDTKKDYLVIDGKRQKIPRYYEKIREIEEPELNEKIKEARVDRILQLEEKGELKVTRLLAKAKVKDAQCKQLKRGLDYD